MEQRIVTYRLAKLAPGSCDVILNGVIIASLVRSGAQGNATWTAELLVDLPPGERPSPFVELAHDFPTLEQACDWLGVSERPHGVHHEAGESGKRLSLPTVCSTRARR
jgi:hypothetical protein